MIKEEIRQEIVTATNGDQNPDKYFKYHQAGHWGKDWPSSTVNPLKGGLCSLIPCESPEKDTNSSTSFMATLSNLGRCFRCHQLGHWAKDCPLSAGINSRGGDGPLSSTNGISEKDVSVTTTCITRSLNPDHCSKSHQQGNQAKDCPSSIGLNGRGGLVSSDVLEKNTNISTSNTAALLLSVKCSICSQLGHLPKDCPSSGGFNAGGGPVSSTTHSVIDANSTMDMTMLPDWDTCFKCFQQGHWAWDCPFSSGFNAAEGPISSTTHSGNDFNSTMDMTTLPDWDTCFKCFQQGHWARDCPSSNGNNVGGGETVSSPTCGIFEKIVNSTLSRICKPSNPDKCIECQQPGHWASDCPSTVSNSKGGPNSSYDHSIPQKICSCGRGPCVIRTSNTAKNPGRKFYKCPSGECRFFEWCDEKTSPLKDNNPPERCGSQPYTSPTSTDGGCRSIAKVQYSSITCHCRAGPCPVRTAKTQKNMGRQFVCCPVRKGDGTCGFFKWCDELDADASSISSVGNSGLFVASKEDNSLGRIDTQTDSIVK